MSESDSEPETGISDDQLPDDVTPGDDNPLAEGLEPGETAGDLLHEGKDAEQSDDSRQSGDDSDESDESAEDGES